MSQNNGGKCCCYLKLFSGSPMLSVNSTCLVFLKCFSDCIHWIDANIISNGKRTERVGDCDVQIHRNWIGILDAYWFLCVVHRFLYYNSKAINVYCVDRIVSCLCIQIQIDIRLTPRCLAVMKIHTSQSHTTQIYRITKYRVMAWIMFLFRIQMYFIASYSPNSLCRTKKKGVAATFRQSTITIFMKYLLFPSPRYARQPI